ncbi:superoxide dismutase [Cu-Zn] SodC2 [Achromobacter mucicolens]|uniref:superoxide dismutase family protein n=1 Tax=Achromobacter mucicolens TaxID=1389922 RepID=UPI0007C87411|nr:superoxide dismutase family protein [Achromobacter mucicolens]OAE64275.1 superoxide dismutase [Achromobacter xylosoxidans]PTW98958.1 superoxide dismutase [Cu-Zn] SodC2 [Achromobacter mucicolens]WGJ88515.1 superoxide dismutase [Cu-Zn] SodC [Achromobacter mucicolens]
MKKFSMLVTALALAGASSAALAEDVSMSFLTPEGVGKSAGTITLKDTKEGLQFTPHLKGLPPGERGFHVHEKGSCEPGMVNGKTAPGGGAGGHLDPKGTKAHKGPMATDGHQGDLPFLTVAADGSATKTVLAPHLKLADVKGHALMIHAGGDNYSDKPEPLGGGGGRLVCGVVK